MLSFLLLIEEKKQKKIKASGTPAKFGWVLDGVFDDAEGGWPDAGAYFCFL